MTDRLDALSTWLRRSCALSDFRLTPASGDASFRRYFRVHLSDRTCIAVDAPPPREDCRPFVAVAKLLKTLGLNVPEVYAQDAEHGFLLLSDLGECLMLAELHAGNVERLYGDALSALATLQALGPRDDELPPYDAALLTREMALFPEWFLQRHLEITLDAAQRKVLDAAQQTLVDSALAQPRVTVHRDYHSRNLMITPRNNPGILDFQDAVIGPVTYDLVSLLRDCYIAWPRARVEDWVLGYHERALRSGILREENPRRFLTWFDLMGVQRHLKAIGIFARLWHRDAKPGYLNDIPRTLAYVLEVAARYPALHDFHGFLSDVLTGREQDISIAAPRFDNASAITS